MALEIEATGDFASCLSIKILGLDAIQRWICVIQGFKLLLNATLPTEYFG